jgi:hypothetical protein
MQKVNVMNGGMFSCAMLAPSVSIDNKCYCDPKFLCHGSFSFHFWRALNYDKLLQTFLEKVLYR